MKNRYLIIIILVFLILGIGLFIWFNFTSGNKSVQKDYVADKTKATTNITTNMTTDSKNNSNKKTDEAKEEKPNNMDSSNESNKKPPKETEISTFSTPIVTQDPARQNNVSITCSTLNDTIVNNGDTFSFCNTVGQATTDKGYQKAEIFDAKRK